MTERVLAQRYELVEPLGSGQVGDVWRARDRSMGRSVAVKIVHEHVGDVRLSDAVRRAATLGHPNIATVYEAFQDDGSSGIAAELVDGVPLGSLAPVAVPRSARIGRQILAALDHAHDKGVVHGDLKPSNVLVGADDEVKVLDFGLMEAVDRTNGATRGGGNMLRDTAFVAPEVTDGRPATPLSDVYSAGCVLYAALTGHAPFAGENPVAVAEQHRSAPVPSVLQERADVGPGYDGIVRRAMAKNPADRYPSVKHMDAAIEGLALDHDQDRPPSIVTHRSVERVHTDEPATVMDTVSDVVVPDDTGDRIMLWAVLGVAAALLLALVFIMATRDTEPAPTPIPTVAPTAAPVLVPVPQPQAPVIVEQPAPPPTVIVVTPAPTAPPPEPQPQSEPEPQPQ